MKNIITNAKYNKNIITGENVSINCVMNGRHISVPLSEQNIDYQVNQEWIDEGNKIEDAD